jgi:hypothetical protein
VAAIGYKKPDRLRQSPSTLPHSCGDIPVISFRLDEVQISWTGPFAGLVKWLRVKHCRAGDVIAAKDRDGVLGGQRSFRRSERPPLV